MSTDRIESFDILKGIGIVLMLYAHTYISLKKRQEKIHNICIIANFFILLQKIWLYECK